MSIDNFYDGPEDEALGQALLRSSQQDVPNQAAYERTALALGLGVAAGTLIAVPAAASNAVSLGAASASSASLGTTGASVVVSSGAAVSAGGGASVVATFAALKSLSIGIGLGIGASVAVVGGNQLAGQVLEPQSAAETSEVTPAGPVRRVVSQPVLKARPSAVPGISAGLTPPQEVLHAENVRPPPSEDVSRPGPLPGSAVASAITLDSSAPALSARGSSASVPAPTVTLPNLAAPSTGLRTPAAATPPRPVASSLSAPIDSLAGEVALVAALTRAINARDWVLADQLVSRYFAQSASRELEQEVRKLKRTLENAGSQDR